MAASALWVVEELWPDAIDPTRRGIYAAAGLIELGRLLSQVRSLAGFGELLHRLKLRDQGAHAELVVAGSLVAAERDIRLSVPCGAKVPDLGIVTGEGIVYVEVVAPERAEVLELQGKLTLELGLRLQSATCGSSIAIQFLADPSRALIDVLAARVPEENTGVWCEVGSSVRYRRGPSTSGQAELEIEWPGVDYRAEKIVRRKCEQLSRNVPNILAIGMNSIGGSVPAWLNAIRNALTPAKNRRLGAVVLYESLFASRIDRGIRLWWVIENPHALLRIPADILSTFAAFDERDHLRPDDPDR